VTNAKAIRRVSRPVRPRASGECTRDVAWVGAVARAPGRADLPLIGRVSDDAALSFVASRPRESEVVFDFIVEDRLLSPAECYADQPAGVTPREPCRVVAAVV